MIDITTDPYQGEPLCDCCGISPDGRFFPTCVTTGYTHEETCATRVSLNDVCAACRDEFGWGPVDTASNNSL